MRRPRYLKEELAQKGDEIYAQRICSQVEPDHNGKIILIDVDTGDWEMDADEVAASNRLLSRHPDAQVWMVRAGSRYARRFGAGRARRFA